MEKGFTVKERNAIYKKALEIFKVGRGTVARSPIDGKLQIKEDNMEGLCRALSSAIFEIHGFEFMKEIHCTELDPFQALTGKEYNRNDYFPEILKHKPEHKKIYWFGMQWDEKAQRTSSSVEGTKKRIEVLEQAIKETEVNHG